MEWLQPLVIVIFFSLYWKFFTKKKAKSNKTSEIRKDLHAEKTRQSIENSSRTWKVDKKKPSATRAPATKKRRSYAGPRFAQAGEVSNLFGYADKTGDYLLEGPFSIIDLETSGFNPSDSKILEIAILKVDFDGNEIERFETLINPGDGNVGPTEIHGIDIEMIKNAPSFDVIVGRIFELLQDSIVVAHNARFEENFLFSELTDSGYDMDPIPALDTLWLARETLDLPNYTLKDIVKALKKRFDNPHTALGDVVAISKVLPEMLSRIGDLYYPISHPELPDVSTPFKAKTR